MSYYCIIIMETDTTRHKNWATKRRRGVVVVCVVVQKNRLLLQFRYSSTLLRAVFFIINCRTRKMIVLCRVLVLCFSILLQAASSEELRQRVEYSALPSSVPPYPTRQDYYSAEPVQPHRLALLDSTEDITLDRFREKLQCLPYDGNIDGDRGIFTFIDLMNMTEELVELMCTWAETGCRPWNKCHALRTEFKGGKYPERLGHMVSEQFTQLRLVRIISGKMYLDWPWGVERFKHLPSFDSQYKDMINTVLSKVGRNIADSVFFIGCEVPYLPPTFPFPAFSASPSNRHGDIPFPWPMSYETRKRLSSTTLPNMNRPWSEKKSKGCFFGGMTTMRMSIFSYAHARPDLLDVGWTNSMNELGPLNPLSTEWFGGGLNQRLEDARLHPDHPIVEDRVGYIEPLVRFKLKDSITYRFDYKYIVVMLGLNGHATADRLVEMLHSNCVVLLQEGDFVYHFSSFLKPYVHFVPISYGAADVIDKIEWLQQNDDIAKQIAQNAKNFADSFLRLEDFYCYVANALDRVAQTMNGTTALRSNEPWSID